MISQPTGEELKDYVVVRMGLFPYAPCPESEGFTEQKCEWVKDRMGDL